MTALQTREVPIAPTRQAAATVALVAGARRGRNRRRRVVIAVLAVAIAAVYATSLMVGHTFYSPSEVLGVVLGQEVPGASFTVGTLRLPRATLALLVGLCFGIGGDTLLPVLPQPRCRPYLP